MPTIPRLAKLINTNPISTSGAIALGGPGASPGISSNGGEGGILWLLQWTATGSVLRAFDATDLGRELYDSAMMPSRDQAGQAVKFTVPTVADGWVFVGAHNELDMYGPLSN